MECSLQEEAECPPRTRALPLSPVFEFVFLVGMRLELPPALPALSFAKALQVWPPQMSPDRPDVLLEL